MAPELFDENKFTQKSDVYSYAMTCYEIATRERPWMGLNEAQISRTVVDKRRRPDLPASTPAFLVDLIQACWTHDPKDRPTFSEIIAHFFYVGGASSFSSSIGSSEG